MVDATTRSTGFGRWTVFESYAQNAEDVRIHRCFPDRFDGFYIDVGASSPSKHSVTYAFYARGWRGVEIDPLEERVAELRAIRPRDVNICAAISDTIGRSILYRSLGRGGTSTIRADLGERMRHLAPQVRTFEVDTITLAAVCHAHLSGRETYEVLKVDVEGAEDSVFRGADFDVARPTVILAEAGEATPSWEHLLLGQGFIFAAYDGINRWYAHCSRADLVDTLAHPVSFADNYRRVDGFSPALRNQVHPDHEWAVALAHALLAAPTKIGEEAILAAYTAQQPQEAWQRLAGESDVRTAVRRVLGRRMTDADLGQFGLEKRTLYELYRHLIGSEEFLLHRGRYLASF